MLVLPAAQEIFSTVIERDPAPMLKAVPLSNIIV